MRERGIIIKVPVSEKEKAMITAKMKSMGIKTEVHSSVKWFSKVSVLIWKFRS